MKQIRVGALRPDRLEPTGTQAAPATLRSRPEYRFQKDIIEAWLRRSNLVDVDSTSAVAAHV